MKHTLGHKLASTHRYDCMIYIHMLSVPLSTTSLHHHHHSKIIGALYKPLVKNPPAMQETWVQSLGWEDLPEKGKATHSSILAWRQSMGSQRVEHD